MITPRDDQREGRLRRWFIAIVGTVLGWIFCALLFRQILLSTSGALILLILLLLD